MEEADAFIKEACRHLECSFADDDDIEFSTPQLFEFLVRCIWKIDNNSKAVLPSFVYPNVITNRLHLGNAISSYLQKLHIRGDIALHTILYGNINNLRSACIELIRKLPIDSQEKVDQDCGHTFFSKARDILKSQPEWVPVYCRSLVKQHVWNAHNNHPELYPLHMFDHPMAQSDPRKWICQYLNSSAPQQFNLLSKKGKPALPPKPLFAVKNHNDADDKSVKVEKDVNEAAMLQEKFDDKFLELKNLENRRVKVEAENEILISKLSQYDTELIDALANPQAYAEELLAKITTLNEQIDHETLKIEKRKTIAAQKKMDMVLEMKKMGVQNREVENIEKMEASLKVIDGKIENNEVLVEKLKKRISDIDGESFYEYEKRSRDLDEMVRKQENEMIRMQEERLTLRKQEERESEAVNRSFAIIYNILLQHCDHYRGRLAMESFTRIHLYCMEIMEMLRENGTLKQAVNCLENEIYAEEKKQYGTKCDMLNRDLQEISTLNKTLIAQIKAHNQHFKLPNV
uniref:Coiled-coil domain-containing protein 22 homolog n=1 Tax=Caenorhabditis japonica TaxID=281687 RepID=A0A8R1HSU4_CAEJA